LQRAGYEVISVEMERRRSPNWSSRCARLALLDWVNAGDGWSGSVPGNSARKEESLYYSSCFLQGIEGDIVVGRIWRRRLPHQAVRCGRIEDRCVRTSYFGLEDHLVEAGEHEIQATHDLLTSLWNGGVILELMSHESCASAGTVARLMMCDIDHLKTSTTHTGNASG